MALWFGYGQGFHINLKHALSGCTVDVSPSLEGVAEVAVACYLGGEPQLGLA